MMLFLLGKFNKTNENCVIDVNIYWKRYPLHYISANILTMIILSSFKVTSTIYLFYNLSRFALELSTNILTMIIFSSFKVTSTIYLFYNLSKCILLMS